MKDRREEKHEYYELNKERLKEEARQRRAKYRSVIHQWYVDNRDRLLAKAKAYNKQYPERVKASRQKINLRYKLDALTHYSLNGEVKCLRCGIADIDVLCLDHINGGGSKHRILIRKEGLSNIYQWLRKNNYPEGFQILCANCNLKKRIRERC